MTALLSLPAAIAVMALVAVSFGYVIRMSRRPGAPALLTSTGGTMTVAMAYVMLFTISVALVTLSIMEMLPRPLIALGIALVIAFVLGTVIVRIMGPQTTSAADHAGSA